jgi:hypothetical protein
MSRIFGSKTLSKKAGLKNLRVVLHERELQRKFEAGEARRLAAQAAANAKAAANAAANAKAKANAEAKAASNERAKILAATLLNRSSKAGVRAPSKSRLRENTKHKNTSKQTHVQNPGGIANAWQKSRSEFNSMSSDQQVQYLQVLKRLGYKNHVIREIYLD